jgi:hypothetical protein
MSDFLNKNLTLLSLKSPKIYSLIKNTPNDNQYIISSSKTGISTLSKIFSDGSNKALHSRYDPLGEAAKLIDANYSNKKLNYILLGLGLGYHLKDLHNRISSQDKIIVFEKNFYLAKLAFTHSDFTDILKNPAVSIYIGIAPEKIEQLLNKDRTNIAIHGYSTIKLKSLVDIDKNYYQLLIKEISQAHQKFKLDIDTLAAFSEKFYKNIFSNALFILESPGIMGLKNIFSKIPVVLVSAGPSLDKNIGFIKSARNKILIITVATALKPLLINKIEPDFVVAIDPNEETIESFNIDIIPKNMWLIYDPCIPQSVIALFGMKKIVMESNIELAKWITDHSEKKGFLNNTSSVAQSAFHLARHMDCEPIILIGQDLSFEGHRMHCTDSFYNQANQDNIGSDRTLGVLEYRKYVSYNPAMASTKDIFQQNSKTTKAMEIYKNQLKKEISKKKITVNATEGGVNIPGAENISLKEALNKHCNTNNIFSVIDLLRKIKKSKNNISFLDSIRKQLEQFDSIDSSIQIIKKKFLSKHDNPTTKLQFILEMESFYKDLIKDHRTIALIQGYDYLAFVEWKLDTKNINNLPEAKRNEGKFLRDHIFITRLSRTINFLCNGFRKIEYDLS